MLLLFHHLYDHPNPPSKPMQSFPSVFNVLVGRRMLAPAHLRGSTTDDDVAWVLARSSGGPRLQIDPTPGDASGDYLLRQLVPVTVVADPTPSPE
jgi:hypothetical protein